MSDEEKKVEGSRFDDDYFNVVSLPMEQQHATTAEDRESFFERLKKQALGQLKPDITTDRPLTTDVVGRGYPARQAELDTISKINDYERALLQNNPSLKPRDVGETRYFICENGKVFKTPDGGLFFGLDTDSMEWIPDQTYMSIAYDTALKFSELKNFRDYYLEREKENDESIVMRGSPR